MYLGEFECVCMCIIKCDSFLFNSVSYSPGHYINCILSSWLFIIWVLIRERGMGSVFWEESGNVGKRSSFVLVFFFSEPTLYVINSFQSSLLGSMQRFSMARPALLCFR